MTVMTSKEELIQATQAVAAALGPISRQHNFSFTLVLTDLADDGESSVYHHCTGEAIDPAEMMEHFQQAYELAACVSTRAAIELEKGEHVELIAVPEA